ncbi:MAG: hypothetical protein K0R67_1063 [Paenibacillus sp.]|jgi:hypothetical protein|nr:hypothetical protein [Paenibacillus sp.]
MHEGTPKGGNGIETTRLLLEAAISFIFLIAALHKIQDFGSTLLDIRSYELIPSRLSLFAGLVLVLTEVLLATAYSLGLVPLIRDSAAILLLVVFSIALIRKRRRSPAGTCNCFGSLTWMNRYPIRRNLLFISTILLIWLLPHRSSAASVSVLLAVVVLSAAVSIWIVQLQRRRQQREVDSRLAAQIWDDWWEISQRDSGTMAIVLLSPELPDWPVMDELLSQPASQSAVIVLDAPVWLVRAKKARWASHRVIGINENGSSSNSPNPSSPSGRVLLVRNRMIRAQYSESLQWLKEAAGSHAWK